MSSKEVKMNKIIHDNGLTPQRFFNLAPLLANKLRACYAKLADSGRQFLGSSNQFGDQTLVADWELEEAVIQFWKSTKFPIGWITEEHGIFDLEGAQYIAYVDGLDGSAVYLAGEGGRCGTMLGLYDAHWSNFGGYIGSLLVDYGCIASSGGNNLVAARDLGAWVDPRAQGQYERIRVNPNYRSLVAYADLYFESVSRAAEKLDEVKFTYLEASLPYYIDLAQGYSWLVLECTRKHSLEIAAAYPLVHEAQGVITDLITGRDLGKMSRSLAESKDRLIVSTTSLSIANKVRDKLLLDK